MAKNLSAYVAVFGQFLIILWEFCLSIGQILKKTICPSGHTELRSAFRHRQKLNVVIKRLGIFFLITDVGDDENKHNMEKFIYGHVDNSFKIIRQIIESVSVVPSRLVCVCAACRYIETCSSMYGFMNRKRC